MTTVSDINDHLKAFARGLPVAGSEEKQSVLSRVQQAFRAFVLDQGGIFSRPPFQAVVGLVLTAENTGHHSHAYKGLKDFFAAYPHDKDIIMQKVAEERQAILKDKQQAYMDHRIKPWLRDCFGSDHQVWLTADRVANLNEEQCQRGIGVFTSDLAREYRNNIAILQARLDELRVPAHVDEQGEVRFILSKVTSEAKQLAGKAGIQSDVVASCKETFEGVKALLVKVLRASHPDSGVVTKVGTPEDARYKDLLDQAKELRKQVQALHRQYSQPVRVTA